MTKFLALVFLLFLMTGCVSGSKSTLLPSVTPQSITESIQPTESGTPETQKTVSVPGNQPSFTIPASPSQTQTVNGPVLVQSDGTLTVQIFSASDVTVTVPTYDITGHAPEGTVISANDQIASVDQTQTFTLQVPLEEGPNLIQVVASDVSGNEVDFMITVTYNSPS